MVQATALPRNEDGIAAVIGILRQQFGDHLQTGQSIREQHGHTTSWINNQPPDAVVFPASTEEVADIVKVCATHKVPLIPFGAGTSNEGHVNAPAGGISVDMGRMNAVLEMYPEDMNCVVQPGVTREQLNTYLRDQGLFFPIDPGANATIGGMTATRASGTNAVRYGTMKDNVIALEVVTSKGDIIRTARRAKKSSAGYDLTRLMVGSEGTLGVITSITLQLQGIPEAMSSARCSFDSVDAACQAAMATIQYGIPVARMELLDQGSVEAVNAYAKLGLPESPLLLLEFHGSPAGVAEQSATFGEIAKECGGTGFEWTTNAEERTRLWQARHDYYWATMQMQPHKAGIATDVCVPISRLAECVARNNEIVEELGLVGRIVGHVGDGNFHTTLLIDMQDQDEVARADQFIGRLNELALSMDGTCTGEHGIGQGKRSYLVQELGETTRYMAAIKNVMDPDNIFNPGKILPE